jgi:putative transposase
MGINTPMLKIIKRLPEYILRNGFNLYKLQKCINMKTYPSDVTESQWQGIENILDSDKRKRKYSLRDVYNAILYVTKSGIQWRMLPKDMVPWQSVYYYFRKWKMNGVFEELHDFLVAKVRLKKGKNSTPSVGIIDSQSVKASNVCEGNVGYDGGKKIKGRKRHIVVDTLGLILAVVIHTASIHDSNGATQTLQALKVKYLGCIKKIFADSGYIGDLIDWAKQFLGFEIEIVKRTEEHKFKVVPKRWIVERTFAWISFHRRLSKDYERLTETSVAFIQISMIRLMHNKIYK